MNHQIDIQNALEPEPKGVPSEKKLVKWASAVLSNRSNDAEMTIRLVHTEEISELNFNYRRKSGATNVLSFPAEIPEEINLPLLGDVVICADVVNQEAEAQNKPVEAHWAHMVVHGILHLLGYDHIKDREAQQMENKEIEILAKLGYPNPYGKI